MSANKNTADFFPQKSDLACERHRTSSCKHGVLYREATWGEIRFSALLLEEGEEDMPRGRYLSLHFPPPALWTEKTEKELTAALAAAILFFSPPTERILVVGLGNRRLTADAYGPLASDGIYATAALPDVAARLGLLSPVRTAVFVPDVFARTGIESVRSVESAAALSRAGAVLALDALAATAQERLLCVLELTDTGTVPGGGVKRGKHALSEATLGIPVTSIGLPTVVRTDAEHFLIPRDLEEGVAALAALTAKAVNLAFGGSAPDFPVSFEHLFSKEEP